MSTQRILIKYGGNAMINPQLQQEIAAEIFKLQQAGNEVVMVHGGGPFINKALEKAAIKSHFIDGLRVTEELAFAEIQKALIGEVNANLVSTLNHHQLKAVGLSGKDAGMVSAKKYEHTTAEGEAVDLGLVGEITEIDGSLINMLCASGYVPVVACIADGSNGESYNINADTFAGKLASALNVDQMIVLTDVDGLFLNYPDPESIIHELDEEAVNQHMGSTIKGGMIPKINSCVLALKEGVKKAIILNGTRPEQIANYVVHNQRIGTTLTL
ncbi:acetylglutamate kinase [Algoriphagus halophytocola]|uniref:Acetylglutamate kinase n=1 Tax=Algoriphagus halophytocola TaxID=2991499 RepID=A0ABY6MI98_9BACT|nr:MULTISPECIES: acetylglutamate kinase [unclassified Algoriphagus]UZD22016.1 acetylglutamate kinase [Algoriphagus sp. TR-M5]WBL43267.1 acetylglutamate kinase [Algoriphagus sp. TR-M9]